MKYVFTKEEIAEIQEARRKNRDKNVGRRLRALELKGEGRTGQEIAEMTGYNSGYISKLAAKYREGGIEAISGNHYGGNRRNMTYEEEAELLEQFINEADGGRITDVSTIKAAYDKKTGHATEHGQIYYVLHGHGWSKKLPRSRHPKSAGLPSFCGLCRRPRHCVCLFAPLIFPPDSDKVETGYYDAASTDTGPLKIVADTATPAAGEVKLGDVAPY